MIGETAIIHTSPRLLPALRMWQISHAASIAHGPTPRIQSLAQNVCFRGQAGDTELAGLYN